MSVLRIPNGTWILAAARMPGVRVPRIAKKRYRSLVSFIRRLSITKTLSRAPRRHRTGVCRFWSARILESSVEGGMPSFAAAPDEPDTRPLHSASTKSMSSFSCKTISCESGRAGLAAVDNQLSSAEKFSESHGVEERSMTFCSSRMYPGQE